MTTFQTKLIEGAKARLAKYRAVEAELEGADPVVRGPIEKLVSITEAQLAALEAFQLPPLRLPTPRLLRRSGA